MHRESFTQRADRLIARLAGRQHGAVGRWQLLELGLSAEQIKRRLQAGRLLEIHRGVYLVGSAARPPHAHEAAALLAVRLRGALSHRSAAALWSLSPYPATAHVWVTIPPELSARRPRIKVVRGQLEGHDLRRKHKMALTSPPRTILDLAAITADPDELERVVAEANYRRIASEAELRGQVERNPGKRGNARLRSVLDLPGGPRRTRSPAERALLWLLRERGIAGFVTNARIAGHEVDFLFPEAALVLEVDGYDAHSGRAAFERDRLKVAELQAHGLSVMPVTGRQVRADPDGVVGRLLAALSARRRATRPSSPA